MEFEGKTALITGGVSGIGFGIARAFAAAGIDLVLTYRNPAYQAQAADWFRQQRRPVPSPSAPIRCETQGIGGYREFRNRARSLFSA